MMIKDLCMIALVSQVLNKKMEGQVGAPGCVYSSLWNINMNL